MHILSSGSAGKAPRALLLALSMGAAGCGSGGVPVPKYDPEGMARAAMTEYDTNSDGKLDAAELESCPALKEALPRIAKDKQPYLTEEDIAERLRQFVDSRVGLMATRCKVLRNGQGVAGVTVTFIPEKFMGDAIATGSGISDQNGTVNLKIEGEDFPGMRLGYYRIEASQKDASGKEMLAGKFNTNSKLGCEVHQKKIDLAFIELD
jgi:hypothetical protein